MKTGLQKYIVHLLALVAFLLVSVAYFYPQFQGKKIQQGDIVQYLSMSQEVRQFQEETGEYSLWTNSMFGGMPTYQIRTVSAGNQLSWVEKVVRFGVPRPAGQFFAAMLCFYILMVVLGANPWLSLIGAFAFGFTTNNLILYEAGHETKLRAISYLPLIAAGLILAFRRRYIWGGILFGLGLGLDLTANHVQMTYYLAMTVIIYGIAQLVHDIRENQLPAFLKSAAALIVGAILAVGAVSSNLWVTYEYTKDTMRGEPILEASSEQAGENNSSETDGLAWNYAMQWSNGAIDLFSVFIPGVAGGGSAEPTSRSSEYGQAMTRLGARLPQEFDAPLYWGDLPFTSGPNYMGAVVVLLFIMGLFLVKGPVKWWLALGSLLTVMLSMGDNLAFFNRILFDYLPLFNKFRSPNSVLSVTAFLVPLLGFLALERIVSGKADKAEVMRALTVGGGIAGAIALFFFLLGPSFFSFSSPGDLDMINRMLGGQAPEQTVQELQSALIETRAGLMRTDALRTLAFAAVAAGLIWAYTRGRIKSALLLGGLALITVIDLVGVGLRYLNTDDFSSSRQYEQNFAQRPVDEQILQDNDPNYRVLDLTVATFESASTSYWHKTIGGYHAAKLQRYQDMIDRHFKPEINQLINTLQGDGMTDSILTAQLSQLSALNMLNTKYIILGAEQDPLRNPAALGNAWFVSNVQTVGTNQEEIEAVNGINPRQSAVVHERFRDYLNGLTPSGEGTISLTSYAPNRVAYRANAAGEQLAVFSEVWYGPDKGWQAYIDGEPVDHIRANYILRALRVPAGEHEIVFEFDPRSYRNGVMVSAIFSSAILLLLVGWGGWQGYQWWQNQEEEPAPKPKKKVKRKK